MDESSRTGVAAVRRFDAHADAVPAARRFVREQLRAAIPDLADTAELCASELVTNAVLHARTSLSVRVTTLAGRARIEVRDGSSIVPRQIAPTSVVTATGRGLALVTTLAADWGVDMDLDGGKVVWCELVAGGVEEEIDADAVLAAWADEAEALAAPPPRDTPTIVLRGYPVRLGVRGREHTDALIRECMLLEQASAGREPGAQEPSVPTRLLRLAEALSAHYTGDVAAPERQKLAALARGEETLDLVYPVRPDTRDAALAWQAMLAELDEYAEQERLLTLATPPDIAALYTWVLEECVRQIDGEPPRPWTGPLA